MKAARERFVLGVVLLIFVGTAWGESGAMKGPFGCHGAGEATKMNEDLSQWVGKFWCTTYSNMGRGPFHHGAWTCTGATEVRNGGMAAGGGYCTITHPGGDTIEVRWDVDRPGPFNDFTTKARCISGSGKYAGIQCRYIGKWNPGVVGPDGQFIGYIEAEYTLP